jgi:hypothetical protein
MDGGRRPVTNEERIAELESRVAELGRALTDLGWWAHNHYHDDGSQPEGPFI